MRRSLHICAIAFMLLGSMSASFAADAKIRFNQDVRPILSNKCFRCHGFDPKAAKQTSALINERLPSPPGMGASPSLLAPQGQRIDSPDRQLERGRRHAATEVESVPQL